MLKAESVEFGGWQQYQQPEGIPMITRMLPPAAILMFVASPAFADQVQATWYGSEGTG